MVQAIYISLFMGVTKNCWYPTPNSYKQCTESSRQLRAKLGISSELRVEGSKREFEEFSSWLRSVRDRHFFDRVWSESLMRRRDFVNCVGPLRTNSWHRNFANPDRYVNKSQDKQTFKSNQESIIVSLTPSLDLSVTSKNEWISFMRSFFFSFVFYTFM